MMEGVNRKRGLFNYRMNRPTYWFSSAVGLLILTGLEYFAGHKGGLEIIMIAVGVPRLHDIGRSGWIVAGIIVLEFAAIFGVLAVGGSADATMITSGLILVSIIALGVWLGTIRGEGITNQWGEPPLAGIQFRAPNMRR